MMRPAQKLARAQALADKAAEDARPGTWGWRWKLAMDAAERVLGKCRQADRTACRAADKAGGFGGDRQPFWSASQRRNR